MRSISPPSQRSLSHSWWTLFRSFLVPGRARKGLPGGKKKRSRISARNEIEFSEPSERCAQSRPNTYFTFTFKTTRARRHPRTSGEHTGHRDVRRERFRGEASRLIFSGVIRFLSFPSSFATWRLAPSTMYVSHAEVNVSRCTGAVGSMDSLFSDRNLYPVQYLFRVHVPPLRRLPTPTWGHCQRLRNLSRRSQPRLARGVARGSLPRRRRATSGRPDSLARVRDHRGASRSFDSPMPRPKRSCESKIYSEGIDLGHLFEGHLEPKWVKNIRGQTSSQTKHHLKPNIRSNKRCGAAVVPQHRQTKQNAHGVALSYLMSITGCNQFMFLREGEERATQAYLELLIKGGMPQKVTNVHRLHATAIAIAIAPAKKRLSSKERPTRLTNYMEIWKGRLLYLEQRARKAMIL